MAGVYFIEDIYDERLDKEQLVNILCSFQRKDETLIFAYKGWLLQPNEISFLQERTVYETNQKVFPVETEDRFIKTKWFEVRSKEEISWVLEKELLFECLINSKNADIEDYTFALYVQENIDGFSLVIFEKREGEFEEVILPKIEKHFSDILKWGKE